MAVDITFHQVGGRCKICLGDEAVSCLKGDIAVSDLVRQMKARRAQQEECLREKWLQKRRKKVAAFLERHNFQDVNTVTYKPYSLGLVRSYPLLLAVKTRDWHMVQLLLFFGADVRQTDRLGRTVFDILPACLSEKLAQMHARVQSKGVACL
mmetsp:Transcript_8947/g.21233  ORF Transcript_8947/g.21233 Transcript_8947/m.21233 type:complete len:152 (+) Transcript_8947:71-526(+)